MKQNLYLTAMAGLIAVSLTGCMDKDYDLSDIDTTSEFRLVDLVLPLNVTQVALDNIITLDDNSALKVMNVDGKDVYAIVKTGDFKSDPFKINDINSDVPHIAPTKANFELITVADTYNFDLVSFPEQAISYTADNIDENIVALSEVFMDDEPSELALAFSIDGGAAQGMTYDLNNVVIDLPAGLQVVNLPSGYKYDPATGVLNVDHVACANGNGKIAINISGMKMTDESTFTGGKLDYNSTITFKSAKLTVKSTSTSTVPQKMSFSINSSLSAMHITAFSGRVHYNLDAESMNIPSVEMNDIPDFFSKDDTRLRLANPQIYIGIDNNPVAQYGLGFSTGLVLTKCYGTNKTPYSPANLIKTNGEYGAGPYNFVLSPTDPKTYPADFSQHLTHVPFPEMGDILYGAGLPDKIDINLDKPMIPEGEVTHFRLQDYPALTGRYELLAPLAFKPEGTVIEYNTTYDDWGSEDLDKLSIKSLTITADAVSTVPMDAVMHITPIAGVAENVQVSEMILKAQAESQPITLTVTGDIRKLQGIKLSAILNPTNENAVSPDQTITLTNLRAKVTGSYLTDF